MSTLILKWDLSLSVGIILTLNKSIKFTQNLAFPLNLHPFSLFKMYRSSYMSCFLYESYKGLIANAKRLLGSSTEIDQREAVTSCKQLGN